MTALWARDDAQRATGGRSQGPDWQAGGVSIDTRTLKPGDLFVALTDVRDGHDFVADALVKGAAAALVSRIPTGVSDDAPLLIVDDVLNGLVALARDARNRTKAKVIAVTGSAGKTSTKEMLRDVLSGQGRVHAAEASYNNHWGVPLTLARMPANTDFAIIEIGMSNPGEIAPLAKLARPHVAVITTIAAAHLEAFDGLEGIAHEKAAVFEGLEQGGVAIINGDVSTASILRDAASLRASLVITFGQTDTADWQLCALTLTDRASVVQAKAHGEGMLFKISAPGRHFAMNALAALATAHAVGADADLAVCDIAAWSPPAGRGTRETVALDPVEDLTIQLMDDAFNANPASMAASFEVLAAMTPDDGVGRVKRGRRIAILGDMLELGKDETSLHADLALLPAMDAIQRVDCVGPRMRALYDVLPDEKRGRWTATAPEMSAEVHHLVDAGDVVLVKGSKGSKVSLVVDAIRKLGQARRNAPRRGS